MARASPITNVTVVLVVGAKFNGQASLVTLTSRLAQADWDNIDSGSPVMLIRGMPRRLINGNMVTTSAVLPEFEMAITTSFLVIMPRSP